MANRAALRELQARLAERLKVGGTHLNAATWLAVRAGSGNYLLPLEQAGEIASLRALQPVPHTRSWFSGVVNLRGNLVGVVDLSAWLASATGRTASKPVAAEPGESFVITFNPQLGVNSALRVDALAGLRPASGWQDEEPAAANAPEGCAQRLRDAQGTLWQVMDLRALVRSAAFLNIGA
jgi:twitching motility protein PilI